MATSILYMASNRINGKRYVGATTASLRERMHQHRRAAAKNADTVFLRAIRKYSFDAFEFFILSRFDTSDGAFHAEKRVIALLNPEYNTSEGGLGGSPWKGKKRSQETKDKIRQAKIGCKAPEATWLMRKTRIDNCQKAAKSRRKVVICVTDGNEFESCTKAAEFYGLDKACISSVCLNKRSSLFGKVFRYKVNNDDNSNI